MKCATASCNEFPAVRVFWPGQTRDMCPECALRAQGIASAMGFALSVAILAPDPDELAAEYRKNRESGDSIPDAAAADGPISRESEGAGRPDVPVLNKSGGSDVCPACGGPLVDYEDDPPRRPPRRWCPSLKCPANLEEPR